MKCTATPFFRSYIGDGFGQVPAVPAKVLSIVLALAIGLILRFTQDDGSVLPRAFAVTVSIFDTNLNDVRIVGRHIAFGDGETALAGFHLNAVISDAETDGEAKSLSQPSGSPGVGVNEHRYHSARRHRSIESHRETLSLTRAEILCYVGARVLLVDDGAIIRKAVRPLFASHPKFEVVGEAEHGRDAIEKAPTLRPDLIILDKAMPIMNGLEAALLLIKLLPHVWLILFTSYDWPGLYQVARSAGYMPWFPKVNHQPT